jgi:hypothetical protein
MEHGEEVALSFDERKLPPLAAGWERTYFFYSDGYEKGHEIHAATALTVDPMPFHGMDAYPFKLKSAPIDDESFWQYQLEWNTRPSYMRR